MKKTKTIIAFLGVLLALVGCHKDVDLDAQSPMVSNEEMTVTDTQASFSWNVDYVGKFQTGVEISSEENMADAKRVEATKEKGKYVVIVDGLTAGTKYFYRIVVWNKYGSFEEKVKDLETHKMLLIQTSCFPVEGGSVIGAGPYEEGKYCTLKAICNEGYTFVNWTENGEQVSSDADYSFLVSSNRTLVANFTLQEFTVSVTANPSQGGTVTGGGKVLFGHSCTVSAMAADSYIFTSWTEDDIEVSTDANYTFTVNGNRTLVAHFTIQVALPTVTTLPVTDITQTTATGGGNITNSGGSSIIERGICWSVNPQPTISDDHFYSGTGTGSFSVPMSDLIPGATYFVRAYAINSGGIAYGEEVNFTTVPLNSKSK